MNRWCQVLVVFLGMLVGCSPATPSIQSPLPMSSAHSPMPTQSPLPTSTPMASQAPTQAPSPASTSLASTDAFPLFPKTSWTYTYAGYSQSPSDPDLILGTTLEIRETVADLERYPSFILVHIQGNRSRVQADPGWQDFESFELGDYEYFYVLQDGNAYRSSAYPDVENIQIDQMLKEFQFPMAVGVDWCPSVVNEGHPTSPEGTPDPCAYTGKRFIEADGPYQTPAGSFEHCHQMRDMDNSGGVIQWFCDGVGVVAMKYDHLGTRFGFTQELTAFTLGLP